MNWADSKHSVNSVNSLRDNTEPSLCNTHEGVETRHGEPLKSCNRCNKHKQPSDFYKKDLSGRLDSTCKSCRIVTQRERVLGVSDTEYWRMYHLQDGRCGICESRLYSKRYKRFAVDHCHSTGKIRGLLCTNCNTALGLMKDDPSALSRAIEWVKI